MYFIPLLSCVRVCVCGSVCLTKASGETQFVVVVSNEMLFKYPPQKKTRTIFSRNFISKLMNIKRSRFE